jgi:hypothetical protein
MCPAQSKPLQLQTQPPLLQLQPATLLLLLLPGLLGP